ncbi:hypothetical protein P3S68_006512 [Capsicum galapagoense]
MDSGEYSQGRGREWLLNATWSENRVKPVVVGRIPVDSELMGFSPARTCRKQLIFIYFFLSLSSSHPISFVVLPQSLKSPLCAYLSVFVCVLSCVGFLRACVCVLLCKRKEGKENGVCECLNGEDDVACVPLLYCVYTPPFFAGKKYGGGA